MKKLLQSLTLVCITVLFVNGSAYSANELFRSNASGNWNTLATWQMSTNNGTSWIAATAPPRDTSGLITIRNPNTVSVTGAVVTASSITIESGASLNGGSTSGSGTLIYGNIINDGTLTAGSTGGYIRIKGASLINNGALQSNGTIYFDSTTTITGSGTFTPSATIISGNVTLGNSITYSPTSYITLNTGSILNLMGNTFTITSGTLNVDNNATVASPGTVRTQNSVQIFLNQLAAFNASLNVNTGDALATGWVSPYEGKIFGNVLIDAGTTLNGGNISGRDLYLYGSVINNGTLFVSSTGATLRVKSPSLTNNGILTAAGTIYFDTTTSLSGAGTFTPSGTIISGNVTLGSNITYSPASYITLNSGSILNPNGNTFTITSGALNVDNNATVSSPGTVRTQNSVQIFLNQLAAFNASLNVNTGNTLATGWVSPWEGKIFGNVTIDAGTTLNGGNISGRDLYLYGSVINNGTFFASSTGGTLRIKGPSLTNNGLINSTGTFYFDTTTAFSGSGSFTCPANFTANANVTLNSNHQMNSLTINAGATFNISNRLLKLNGINPITQNGTFTTINSDVEYNWISMQSISTTNIVYSGLRINNPAGTILTNNISISDTLAVILGDLDLNGKIITILTTGILTESAGNTVKGNTGYITATRNVASPNSLNVGGLGAILTTASNLGSTEIRRGHTLQTGLNGGTSIRRYFDIIPTTNTGLNATLVFKYDDSELNGKPEPSLKLFKSTNSGATWLYQIGNVNVNTNEITLSGIPSFSRWSSDSSAVSASVKMVIQGFYDASTNSLNMSDTVRAYLRNTTFPYTPVDSAKEILNYSSLRAAFQFKNATSGTYYLQIKHRNSIETWSSNGLLYSPGTTLNQDFSFSANMAFGNNQVQVDASPLLFAFWSGDVNQDGTVDAGDISEVENDVSLGTTGYVPTDVNGDDFVDGSDVSIVENNASNSVVAVLP